MKSANWVDWNEVADTKYRKKLIQAGTPKEFASRLITYFDENDNYNEYSLALHLGMTLHRFTNNYLKSDNRQLASMAKMACNTIAAHALSNADEYKQSLRYIMSRANTDKDFIELDDAIKDSNQAQVIILPSKDK